MNIPLAEQPLHQLIFRWIIFYRIFLKLLPPLRFMLDVDVNVAIKQPQKCKKEIDKDLETMSNHLL